MDDVWKTQRQRLRCAPVKFHGPLFFALVSIVGAQDGGTALDALKLLPKDAAKRLARIEARDVTAVPERWYFIVHDPVLPRGMREFVVAGGKVAASRELSQFSESVSAADVVGSDAVKMDSDRVARLAGFYAAANGGRVGSINFELSKDAAVNAPAWRATVLNPEGDQLGVLTVNAAKGVILSHDGFENEPPAELLSSVQAGLGAPPRSPATGQKGSASQASAVRGARATPTPKANLFRRIFGTDEGKPAKTGQ